MGVLWQTADEARGCAFGDIALAFCPACGLLTNVAFDGSLMDYTLDYDNSLHSSAVFREFESGLVADLIGRHQLDGGHVVEVGCGDGHFLQLLCAQAGATGDGFDPSIGASRTLDGGRVRLHAEYFDEHTEIDRVDLLCCRQVLEHIPAPRPFLEAIGAAMGDAPTTPVYMDVPNSSMLLEDLSIWDLVYEHCHYFLTESLTNLVRLVGYEVDRSWTSFGDQFLSVELKVTDERVSAPVTPARISTLVESFANQVQRRRRDWTDRLVQESADGHRVVIWGAGARAVSFCSMVDANLDRVAYLVDANPKKQGTYLAGTGHSIRPPAALAEDPPDLVILLNGIYETEIREQLKGMDLTPTVVVA